MGRFLDISDYNNVNNYGAFASSGLIGAICKASEGTTNQEDTFNEKYNGIKSVGLKFGAYHMLCITSAPETQAQNFANMLSGKQLDIYPVLDVEYDNLRNVAEDYSNRFIAKFKELTGMDMIVYSCESYLIDCFSDTFRSSHALWIANYFHQPTMGNMVAWQFTESCGDYGFVDGDVDCNELLDGSRFFIDGQGSINIQYGGGGSVQQPNEEIRRLQHELNVQGFRDYNGNALAEDGYYGELTLSACPLVKRGAEGNITQWVQLRVGVNPDCDFGQDTENGVIYFQQSRGITADGEVGKNTWRELLKSV